MRFLYRLALGKCSIHVSGVLPEGDMSVFVIDTYIERALLVKYCCESEIVYISYFPFFKPAVEKIIKSFYDSYNSDYSCPLGQQVKTFLSAF